MISARSRSLYAFAVLALAASLGLALAEQSLPHTDDGCAVEIHCVACRLLLGSVVVTPTQLSVEPRFTAVGDVSVPEVRALPVPARRVAHSRGPPASFFSAS